MVAIDFHCMKKNIYIKKKKTIEFNGDQELFGYA